MIASDTEGSTAGPPARTRGLRPDQLARPAATKACAAARQAFEGDATDASAAFFFAARGMLLHRDRM
jgi:hypothetical protein